MLAGIHFSQDFSRDVAAGRPASLQALIDGRRANAGQITLSYLQTIASDYGAEVTGASVPGVPQAEVRHWFNENLRYTWYFVPGMMGILAMFISLVLHRDVDRQRARKRHLRSTVGVAVDARSKS